MKKRFFVFVLSILLLLSIFAFTSISADYNLANLNNSTSANITNTSSVINASNSVLPKPANNNTPFQQNGLPITEDNVANQNTNVSSYAPALSQDLICRINFNIAVLNLLQTTFPNASSDIQPSVNTLQNDLNRVQSRGDNSSIEVFDRGQYSKDINDAISSTKFVGRDEKGATIASQRGVLVSSYNQLKISRDQCEQQSYKELTQKRIQNYQEQIADFQNKIVALSNKGFNVNNLTLLLQNAQTQIIQPLQSALSTANSIQSIQTAVQSYCLYDGCTNGTNFHLDAKFNIGRLNTIFISLQTNSTELNISSTNMLQIQQDLSNAQSTLDSVGNAAYQNGQAQTIFSNIQDASSLIVQTINQAFKARGTK